MLALGIASFSHINGVHFQNEPHMDPYLARLQNDELPITRTLKPTSEELMIREFILQLKLGELPIAYFQNKFNVDVLASFDEPLRQLQEKGFLTFDETHIRLTRKGLLQIDGLLSNFFLPKHA